MTNLKKEDIAAVKGKGFLINRGTECFSGRIVAEGTVFSAENLKDISYMAEHYGNGTAICTSRLAMEIPGIPFEKINDIMEYASNHGLRFGGTGAKVRPVVACKGTTCIYGNYDTQALAKKIHNEYYIGWTNVKLPHKFKIAVGGCPNSCIKPSLNDFGVEGNKIKNYNIDLCKGCKICQIEINCPKKAAKVVSGKLFIDPNLCNDCGVCVGKCPFNAISPEAKVMYKIFVGGTWGKSCRMGTPLSRLVNEDEILPILEKSMLWFKENGNPKERFGLAIDRIGFEKFEKSIMSNDLLERKQQILQAE